MFFWRFKTILHGFWCHYLLRLENYPLCWLLIIWYWIWLWVKSPQVRRWRKMPLETTTLGWLSHPERGTQEISTCKHIPWSQASEIASLAKSTPATTNWPNTVSKTFENHLLKQKIHNFFLTVEISWFQIVLHNFKRALWHHKTTKNAPFAVGRLPSRWNWWLWLHKASRHLRCNPGLPSLTIDSSGAKWCFTNRFFVCLFVCFSRCFLDFPGFSKVLSKVFLRCS